MMSVVNGSVAVLAATPSPGAPPTARGRPDPSSIPGHCRRGDGCANLTFPSSSSSTTPLAVARPAATAVGTGNNQHIHSPGLLQPSFRKGNRGRPKTTAAARLWNPTNSTPRIIAQQQQRRHRKRQRPSPSPPPPAVVPLQHPVLSALAESNDPLATTAASYPLLTLSEQRQSRHAASSTTTTTTTTTNLQIERTGTSQRRVSLPPSIRPSFDAQRSSRRTSAALDTPKEKTIPRSRSPSDAAHLRLPLATPPPPPPPAESKGKQKATAMATADETSTSFSRDLERGSPHHQHAMNRPTSTLSAAAAPSLSSPPSSSNSSIMGEDLPPDAGEEWGPQHPCFPHMNPHVPVDSTDYATTRIIRVKRDWLVAGDLAPTFSNLYPEILDPAGVSEQEFRRVVDKLNGELIPIFDPFGFRNVLDCVLGLVTGWLWDDFGLTAAKARLDRLETWMERWNLEMEKTMASEEGVVPPKLISLRQTGYMNLDIQIPDPEIAPAPSTIGAGESSTALPLEPLPAITAGGS